LASLGFFPAAFIKLTAALVLKLLTAENSDEAGRGAEGRVVGALGPWSVASWAEVGTLAAAPESAAAGATAGLGFGGALR